MQNLTSLEVEKDLNDDLTKLKSYIDTNKVGFIALKYCHIEMISLVVLTPSTRLPQNLVCFLNANMILQCLKIYCIVLHQTTPNICELSEEVLSGLWSEMPLVVSESS